MTNADYAARQLAGVWKMIWNNPGWEGALDRSIDGVFKSFWALFYATPFAILAFLAIRRAAERTTDFPETPFLEASPMFALAVQAVGYLADWFASLAALVFTARAAGAGRRAADIIVGFNWLQVFIAIAQAAPFAALAVLGGGAASILFLPATAFVIALYWGFIRRSTGLGAGPTIGLIIMLTLIGLVVSGLVGAIAALFQ